ncbi:MAG: amino acid ABC transporter permease [Parachlamydiaceae bacterium]|nr:amino acid ABC transporter permease [Parachlamydiaceae bacterium]
MFSRIFSAFIQALIAIALIYLFYVAINQKLDWSSVWAYRSMFFKGWLITIGLSIACLLLSLLTGLLAALCARSRLPLLTLISSVYVEIIRGTPLLVQILFFFYVVANHIGLENRYVAGVIILSLFNGAYIAEMIRSGIETVSETQLESARAIGLSQVQAYRFVIFPQAIRQIIPPLTGQFVSIIKDSSLLSIIGINELTNSAQQINSATYSTLETYFPLGLAYLVLTLPISLWSKRLEKRFQYET